MRLEYGPLPWVAVALLCFSAAAGTAPLALLLTPRPVFEGKAAWAYVLVFASVFCALFYVLRVAKRERDCPPVTVPVDSLGPDELPSSFTRISPPLPTLWSGVSVKVCHLYQSSPPPRSSPLSSIVYFHGFGASSLSWLPVFPDLHSKLCPELSIACDALGFGLTRLSVEGLSSPPGGSSSSSSSSSPDLARLYGRDVSADLSLQVLRHNQPVGVGGSAGRVPLGEDLLIVGHSMGSTDALLFAQAALLPSPSPPSAAPFPPPLVPPPPPHSFRRVFVVLVSPALFVSPSCRPCRRGVRSPPALHPPRLVLPPSPPPRVWLPFLLARPFLRLSLRLLVGGGAAFWRGALSTVVWSTSGCGPTAVDVLRYAWPSAGRGWEDGLLDFCRCKAGGMEGRGGRPEADVALFRDVAERGAEILVLHGERDKLVEVENSRRLVGMAAGLDNVKLEIRKEAGHCFHEEFPERFVEDVVAFYNSWGVERRITTGGSRL